MKRASLARRVVWTLRLTVEAPMEERLPFRSAERLERLQRRRLGETVEHAHRHVPYYRETMRRLGLGPGDFRTAADLARLPLIERDRLQADPEYFVSEAEPLSKRVELHTGGSTGEPLTYFRDRASLYQRQLGFQRAEPVMAKLTGRRWRRRIALIAPPSSSTTDLNRAVGQSRVRPSLRTVVRFFSLFDPLPELATKLDEFRPDAVNGYGSAIEALYAHLISTGREFHRPRLVTFGGDGLSEQMRAALSERGIEVLSVYQAVETPTIGWECDRHSGHHHNLDLCPVRILDESGREAPVGESGRVIVSNLVNHGTILLNYALGDLAARIPEPCPCGRTLPLLSQVQGRTSEWLRSRSGAPVHPQALRSILRHLSGVRRYRLVQERAGEVVVTVVAAPEADRAAIAAEISSGAAALPDPLEARVEFSETLPRSEGGKVRTITSAGTAP